MDPPEKHMTPKDCAKLPLTYTQLLMPLFDAMLNINEDVHRLEKGRD